MKIEYNIFNSPVLQGGVIDVHRFSFPENLEKFIFQFLNFSKFSECIRVRLPIPALKDGAINHPIPWIRELVRFNY